MSAIYGWASRPTRRLVPSNPVRAIELPPNDETPRTRVAPLEEAERLLAALEPNDRVPYALAFYAGLRREEIYRLRWEDVEIDGYRLVVRKAKSAAGTNRRPPIAEPLREILRAAALRNASDAEDPVSSVSVMSGKLAERATAAWKEAGQRRITLHGCTLTGATEVPPLVIPGGTQPDWGSADVPPARQTDSGGSGGSGGQGSTLAITVAKSKLKAALRNGLKLSLTLPAPGKLSATATRKGKTVAKAAKRSAKAGKQSITLKFSKAARRSLARSRSVKLTIRVAYTPKGGAAKTTTQAVTLKR